METLLISLVILPLSVSITVLQDSNYLHIHFSDEESEP